MKAACLVAVMVAAGAALAGAGIPAAKFNHAAHAGRKVAVEKCATCHGDDRSGRLAPPGRSGHQPCLASGCHVDEFLAIGEAARKAEPERYRKAAGFCLGCHASATGDAPLRYQKPPADNVYRNNPAPEHHVEMDHLEHARKVPCRNCHVVDGTSFRLLADRPGHAECGACHGTSAPPMNNCSSCHEPPGPAAYFANHRRKSDVRSCDPDASGNGPCFLHERREHRLAADAPLQCDSCHFMMADPNGWAGHKYRTLRDVAAAPIIHNRRDRAHKSCGSSSACHQRDVSDGRGTARCNLCHSKRVTESIFD